MIIAIMMIIVYLLHMWFLAARAAVEIIADLLDSQI
jgi:hypothetical protein